MVCWSLKNRDAAGKTPRAEDLPVPGLTTFRSSREMAGLEFLDKNDS